VGRVADTSILLETASIFLCFANLRPTNSWAGFYDVNSLDSTPIVTRKEEAKLFGDQRIGTLQLGLTNRAVPKEEFVI
jgi:glycine/D-amino acid oxidase-like deaminating enzyme